jgi:transcriptional regulator with XRE-family HTH domain
MHEICKKIRNIRKLNDYSQEYISYELGLSQSQYSRRENGTINFSIIEIEKLCKLFNIKIEVLVSEDNFDALQIIEKMILVDGQNKNKIIVDLIFNSFDLLLNNNFSHDDYLFMVNELKNKIIHKNILHHNTSQKMIL